MELLPPKNHTGRENWKTNAVSYTQKVKQKGGKTEERRTQSEVAHRRRRREGMTAIIGTHKGTERGGGGVRREREGKRMGV